MVKKQVKPKKLLKKAITQPKKAKFLKLKKRIKIILDTNFIMIPSSFGVDIFREFDKVMDYKYDLIILRRTLDELEEIKQRQRGKHRQAAKLAIDLIKAKNINILSTAIKHVDDAIVKIAKKDCFVATQDKDLKRRLKKLGYKVIVLRQKKYLKVI